MSKLLQHLGSQRSQRLGMVTALLLIALSHRGWTVEPLRNDLDPSWAVTLTYAHVQGLQFGEQFIFTYGPFGFLANHFSPLIWTKVALLTLCVAALAATLLAALSRVTRSAWSAVGLLMLIWLLVEWDPLASALLVGPALLAWFGPAADDDGAGRRRDTILLHLSMVALALAALVKLTFAVQAALTVAAVGLRFAQQRKIPWVWLSHTLALLVFWISARQSIANVPGFVRSSLQIISGYDAMSLSGLLPASEVAVILAWSLVLLTLWSVAAWHRWRWWAAVMVLVLAGNLFMLFKHGVVRHDTHVLSSVWHLLALTVLIGVLSGQELARAWRRRIAWGAATGVMVLALAAASLIVYQVNQVFTDVHLSPIPAQLAGRLGQLPRRLIDAGNLLRDRQALTARWEQQLRTIQAEHPLPNLQGSVDFLGDQHQALAIAYGYDYTPRPIHQSYSAYTPWLQRINHDFYQRAEIPRHVLLSVEAIDLRWPALSDAPAWPTVMARYEPVDLLLDRSLLHLQRRHQPRRVEFTPLGTHALRFDEPLALPDLPAGSMLWAKVRMPLTPFGRAVRSLYKTPMIRIQTTSSHGRVIARRFIPAMAEHGFVLSPFIANARDFALAGWASPQSQFWNLAKLRSVSWSVADEAAPHGCYQDRIEVELYQLRLID